MNGTAEEKERRIIQRVPEIETLHLGLAYNYTQLGKFSEAVKEIQAIAEKSVNKQNHLQRELLFLLEKAKKLYPDKKSKSKKRLFSF